MTKKNNSWFLALWIYAATFFLVSLSFFSVSKAIPTDVAPITAEITK